jgi:hypothetical protein
MTLQCPRCRQMGYEIDCHFHWCGDNTKQCGVCGKDWPSNRCPKCYKIGYGPDMPPGRYGIGVDCPTCGRPFAERIMENQREIQQVKLPYPFPYDQYTGTPLDVGEVSQLAYIEAWSERPGRLLIRLPIPNGTYKELLESETKKLLRTLVLQKENIPGWKKNCPNKPKPEKVEAEQVEHISMKEWEEFKRWKESKKELEELGDDNLTNLKELLRAVTISCPEFDEEMDDLIEGMRKAPRLVRYIKTGSFPSMEMDDDDLAYYDESHVLNGGWNPSYSHSHVTHAPMKRKPRVVEVHIEDISDGKL